MKHHHWLSVNWDDDEPHIWEAFFFVLDRKHPEYEHSNIHFDEMPSRGHYGWEEPSDASGRVDSALDIKTWKQYPALSFTIEDAWINEDDGQVQGYYVTLKAAEWKDGKEIRTLFERYAIADNDEFEFRVLEKVASPKIEVIAK